MKFRNVLNAFGALLALGLSIGSATAQQPTPPDVPLWRMEADGNAVQTDLGFILPTRIGAFERKGFSSTRPDGASVMAWYETADGLKLRILIQLRVDVRGMPLPGADPIARNWPLMQIIGPSFYRGAEPEELAEERIAWDQGEAPNAMMQLLRYPLAAGPEIQGIWYRNIGLWAVVAIASGPEARRTEIEAAGQTVRTELKWPGAPMNADLRAISSAFLRDLRDCQDLDRSGSGRPVEVNMAVAAGVSLMMASHFLDNAPSAPNPVTDPAAYCRVETIQDGRNELIALAWRGDPARSWAARYAFMTPRSGRFMQFESAVSTDSVSSLSPLRFNRVVHLSVSDERSVAVVQMFDDWPSYEDAKAYAVRVARQGQVPLVEATHPAEAIRITVNTGRVTDGDASAQSSQ